MEKSSQSSDHVVLDDSSYCIFYIENGSINFASNFKTPEDVIELLHIVRNTDMALDSVCESLSDEDAAKLEEVLDSLSNKKTRPVISPLSMSRLK